MESASEGESFLENIKPPRLEDAGLEFCALPPESIREAFMRAASAVRSVVSSESEGRCVEDPWEDSSDVLVGITDGVNAPSEGCATEKGSGLTEALGDKVAVGGADAEAEVDAVVGPGLPEGGEACVDGLQGLEIGGKSRGILGKNLDDGKDDVDEDKEKGKKDRPILAEGFDV